MSTQAIPQIPPRPSRAQAQEQPPATATGSSLGSDIPRIPPRPTRRIERSQSPNRDSYARSPLNEPAFVHGSLGKPQFYGNSSANNSSSDLPARPSSVVLPSLGQEGSEYAEVCGPDVLVSSPTQTRNISNDLQLHAPKPSLPSLSAKQRVSTVTRTDSSQAAAAGIGKSTSDDKDPHIRSLKAKSSFASDRSSGTEHIASDNEHGPEVGQRVPMYPNAGFVQAPSPSPFATQFPAGIGYHNDGSKPRHHGRRTSARGAEVPPGSYGLFGHGIIPKDRFEQAYYEKHPELVKKETGHYSGAVGEGRGEWALSSEDLNKIVRETASRGSGLGTSGTIGTPSEQVGFLASEEYASRMSSPRPQSAGYQNTHSNSSQTHVDSPLRKGSFPADVSGKAEFDGQSLHRTITSDTALESEYEDDDVVHVNPSAHRTSKIYGAGHMESTDSLTRHISHTGDESELEDHGYSAPILASDEVAKEPFGYELQPAVSPMPEHRGGAYDNEHLYHFRTSSQSSLPGSKPSSRPGSTHGTVPGFHFSHEAHSTPLEDLDEYEPLFPDEENSSASKAKPMTPADRLKSRPDLQNRRFPSQDVWEDTPSSLQYTATVSTPQLPEDTEEQIVARGSRDREGETPEMAFARRQEELAEKESHDSGSFLNHEKKPWAHKSHLTDEMRPQLKQRFPSRDIWEDNPDSLNLQTTVSAPQTDDERDIMSPPDERPTTGGVVYHQEKAAAGFELGDGEGRATTGIAATLKPQIPARPSKLKSEIQPVVPERPQKLQSDVPLVGPSSANTSPTSTKGAKPAIPERTKPQIPLRPAKSTRDSTEDIPLSKVTSGSSAKSVGSDSSIGATKTKPPVPSRPVGSKIAALQGGFMSDLNKRLQLGPQAPKKEEAPEEPAEEKAPLVDARKSRARGPARRAPAKSPAPAVESATVNTLSFSSPSTTWQIHPEDGLLNVVSYNDSEHIPEAQAATDSTPTLATNLAGQSVHETAETTPTEVPHALESEHAHKEQHPPVASATPDFGDADDEVDILSGSTATITPENKDEIVQTGESVIHTNTSEDSEHATAGTKERLVAFLGGNAHDGGDVVVKEALDVPGSFEPEQ